ncbi:MAG: hypothetical protein KDA84_04980, partial [Planctomycetaceae bacterium]|nr:hypothetical protein [Planctomycetaceae bacterium]
KVVAHIERKPVPITQLRNDIPSEVIHVLQRMLEKDSRKRYQSPAEVVGELKSFLKDTNETSFTPSEEPTSPVISIETHTEKRTPQVSKRNRNTLVPIVGVTTLAIVCGVLLWWVSSNGTIKSNRGHVESGPAKLESESNGQTEPEWIELIPEIDMNQPLSENWSREGGELHVDATRDAHLTLPHRPLGEYDFEVRFTRQTGQHSIAMIFVAGSGQATFEVDAWDTDLGGIQLIDGLDLNQQPRDVFRHALENDTEYRMLLRVRRDSIEAYLNENLVTRYQGDGSNLSLLGMWNLGNQNSLGIGAFQSRTTFHSIRIRPVEASPRSPTVEQ